MSERAIPPHGEPDDMAMQVADAPLDIRNMSLDLSKDERIRTVALMMGIRYHVDTIVKDPRYLELMIQREKEAKFSNEPDAQLWHLRPSTTFGVISIAQAFEAFLTGKPGPIASLRVGDEEIEPVGRAQGETQADE